jgi:hypothetical protein
MDIALLTPVAGLLGLLAFVAGIWRRSWRWWLTGYALVVVATLAAMPWGGA